jgi:hypothetical protein
MALKKLQLRAGINRESTSLANEGGWFDGDKIRFRSGSPEKLGGWLAASYNTFTGTCRSMWNWITLRGYNLLALGTNKKFYIENEGTFYDITPLRGSASVTFARSIVGTADIIVTCATITTVLGGDYVRFTGAVSLGGNITAAILNQEYIVAYNVSSTQFVIRARTVSPVDNPGALVLANASDSGNGGASSVGAFQIPVGSETTSIGLGWGTGTWNNSTGWGQPNVSGSGVITSLRRWSMNNFGEDLLFSYRGGPIFLWQPGNAGTPAYTTRGTLVSGVDVPAYVIQLMVSSSSRITIAFGSNDYGVYGSGAIDPLLIRWSAQEDYTAWTPSATNQAGSFRLSHGSFIVGALQTRQEILVWTDAAVYSMQYIGTPYVWSINLITDNISLASPTAVVTANGTTFWMGTDKFYSYAGRVETLPCSVWKYVYDDINLEQADQFFGSSNEGFAEIWWFYCSKNSSTLNRYVIFNYLDRVWYYGQMDRTYMLDSPIRRYPMAVTGSGLLVYHEAAVDDGTTNPPSPISAYVQSSDFNIDDGHDFGIVWRMVPDITFDGSSAAPLTPRVEFTMLPKQAPGARYGVGNNMEVSTTQQYGAVPAYTVQEFTEIIYTRVRGRSMSFKITSDTLGTQWQLGAPSIDVRKDGKR